MAKRKTVSSDNETNYGSDPEQHDYKNYARMKDAVSLFAFTLDNVSESACITDSEGNIVFLNQAGKLLLGISASQVNESNIFHKLGGVNRDEFFSAFVDRDQQKWEGDLSVFNKREIPVHVRSSRFQAPDGMVYISTIMTEKQDLDEKLSIRSYCDFAESLPSVGLGIWHLEGSISPNIIPIFRLIQLNRSARERLSPIEIEIGRTINESLREPHNRDTALFFASVLLTGTPSYIDQFTLDGKAQFSIRAFPLKYNCIAIYFDVAMKETVPHEVFYELFDYYPLLTALFQKDPEGPDYTWRISCAMSRNIRKEGWRPPVGTKLSQMAQRMTSDPKLLAAVNIAKPGQSVRIVVNDWTNNQYKGHIFEGQILKLNRDYIALVFKPLNAETLQLETNLLNFASQRTTKLDERLADTFFFNESLVPIYNNEDSPPLDQLPYPSIANIAPSHQPPIPVYAPPVEPTLTKKFNYSISDMSRPQFAAQQQRFVPQSKHSRPYPEAPPVPEKPDHLSSLLHHISGSELSAEYFKRGFYESSIGMTMVSPQGNFLAINNALCRALGYSTDEFLQHSFLPMTHPEDIDKSVGLLRQMLNGEIHTFHMLKRYLHKYGHVIWCLLSTSLVRDHNGNPIFFITQIIPVESVRNMLNGSEVKRDEELYHQLFSSCPQGSCILTRDGGISSVNRMMCSLTEYEAFEIIGKPILNVVCKEDADNIRNTIGRLCMETKSSSAFAYLRIDAKNSGPKWIYAQLVNLPDSNGYTTHVGLFVQEFLSLQRIANMEQHQPVNSKWDKYH